MLQNKTVKHSTQIIRRCHENHLNIRKLTQSVIEFNVFLLVCIPTEHFKNIKNAHIMYQHPGRTKGQYENQVTGSLCYYLH